MALIRTSSIISEIRNSIGGVTFTRARAGAVARARIKPCYANTPALQRQRAFHSIKIGFWRNGLTNAQRLVWNTAALTVRWINSLGEEYQPSGYLLFMRQAQERPETRFALPVAPVYPLKTPPPALFLSWNEAQDRIYLNSPTGSVPPANGFFYIWYTDPLPPTYYHVAGRWTFKYTITFTQGVPVFGFIYTGPYPFRPMRIYFRIRATVGRYTQSDPVILGLSIPAAP